MTRALAVFGVTIPVIGAGCMTVIGAGVGAGAAGTWTRAVGGGIGTPGGGVLSEPQWKMRVVMVRTRPPRLDGAAGPSSRMVMVSPVSMALTWKAWLPSGVFQFLITLHFCAGPSPSWT